MPQGAPLTEDPLAIAIPADERPRLLEGTKKCPRPCKKSCPGCYIFCRKQAHHWVETTRDVPAPDYRCKNCGTVANALYVWSEEARVECRGTPLPSVGEKPVGSLQAQE
jgi:hypothetical protein